MINSQYVVMKFFFSYVCETYLWYLLLVLRLMVRRINLLRSDSRFVRRLDCEEHPFSILLLFFYLFNQHFIKLKYGPCGAFLFKSTQENFHSTDHCRLLNWERTTIILRQKWCDRLIVRRFSLMRHFTSSHLQEVIRLSFSFQLCRADVEVN